jgi:hypothetical protein
MQEGGTSEKTKDTKVKRASPEKAKEPEAKVETPGSTSKVSKGFRSFLSTVKMT